MLRFYPVRGDLGDLLVTSTPGGSATINFQAEVNCDGEGIVNEAELSHEDDSERAITEYVNIEKLRKSQLKLTARATRGEMLDQWVFTLSETRY